MEWIAETCQKFQKVSKGLKGWLGFSGAKRTSEMLREVRWKVLTDWMHTFAENCWKFNQIDCLWYILILIDIFLGLVHFLKPQEEFVDMMISFTYYSTEKNSFFDTPAFLEK